MPKHNPATPVVGVIVGACLLVYLSQLSGQGFLLLNFALWPPLPAVLPDNGVDYSSWPGFAPWQLITYAFLHGSPMHLLFNLFGLWMFGVPVERALGTRRFLIFYFSCVLGAAIAQILLAQWSDSIAPTIGASGGVLGLLPAFALLYPRARIQLLFPPISMKAPVFVVVFGIAELLFGVTDTLPGIAHFAHLGGMLSGGVILLIWMLTLPPDDPASRPG